MGAGDNHSLLFGVEKSGKVNLVESVREFLTPESILISGSRGRPVKLKKHIDQLAAAFRKSSERNKLPSSISGLWKADLFIGRSDPDHWVGTTVKINQRHLEAARGLRLAIVPADQGKSDLVRIEEAKNLVVVPVPYDGAFMEVLLVRLGNCGSSIGVRCEDAKGSSIAASASKRGCAFAGRSTRLSSGRYHRGIGCYGPTILASNET